MSSLLSRFRKRNSPRSRAHVQQAFVPVSILKRSSPPAPESPPLERKIVSDINSLVEAHISDFRPSNEEYEHTEPDSPPSPEFVALQPRRRPPQFNSYTPDNSATADTTTSQVEALSESSLSCQHLSDSVNKPPGGSASRRSVVTIPSPSSGADNGWSTFGRARTKPQPAPHDNGHTPSPPERPTSASESVPPSRSNSQSRRRSSNPRPHTPTSDSPSYYMTPLSQFIDWQGNHAHTPSNHTFGKPTPPSSGFTFRSRHSSSPNPGAEIIPPLPPLDHPAFQFPSPPPLNTGPRKFQSSDLLNRLRRDGERKPRSSTSLPTLSQPRERVISLTRNRRKSGTGETRLRPRSRKTTMNSTSRVRPMDVLPSVENLTAIQPVSPSVSSAGAAEALMTEITMPKRTRGRTLSKSSKHSRNSSRNSSRRSSAEFSAMQVSALGRKPGSESWEAQVALEMLRASLGDAALGQIPPAPDQDTGKFAKIGQARGNNVLASSPPVDSLELGSPFLLQESHTLDPVHPLPDNVTVTDYEVDKNDLEKSGSKGKGKGNATVMSQEIDTPTPSPTKGKEKERGKEKENQRSNSNASMHRRGGPRRSMTSRPRLSGPPQLAPIPSLGQAAGPSGQASLLMPPPALSLTGPTPTTTPVAAKPSHKTQSILHHQKSATEPLSSALRNAATSPAAPGPLIQKSYSGGKRKLDEAGVDSTPPPKEHLKTTFAVGPRPHRASERSAYSSLAPSSYHRKRARLSSDAKPNSRPGSRGEETTAANTGTWSSRSSVVHTPRIPGSPARTSSQRYSRPPSSIQHQPASPSRRSISQASLPISALVSPHAPSISRSSQYHMRDPRKPPPVQPTSWSLSFPVATTDVEGQTQTAWTLDGWVERGGSPLHAWLFFVGFLLFPIWWVASFLKIRKTRRLDSGVSGAQSGNGAGQAEKGTMLLDDPQLEHDAHSWRTRCRVMAGVSLVTYIPFIILIAIFAR
ncbi:hypothetical protein AX16_006181 [Volvariella volvacea WC 439]|nr:hypothetical protein AX16_006181 [Volvariella volvacea WC 439]